MGKEVALTDKYYHPSSGKLLAPNFNLPFVLVTKLQPLFAEEKCSLCPGKSDATQHITRLVSASKPLDAPQGSYQCFLLLHGMYLFIPVDVTQRPISLAIKHALDKKNTVALV